MKKTSTTPSTIDVYIQGFPENVQALLQQMRTIIKKAAPRAEEAISYGIPTFKIDGGNIVHFGGFKNHIGLYPTASGTEAFEKELAIYKTSKGAVQFPLDKKLPVGLISQIVKYRVKKNEEKTATAKKKTK